MKKYLCFILVFMISCNTSDMISDPSMAYVEKNFHSYSDTYDEAQAWIKEMVINRTKTVAPLIYYSVFEMDKLMLFNKNKTKCIGTINISSIASNKSASADKIRRFQGVKIDSEWYFFMGASLVLPREYYKYDMYEALTFEELSYLARKEFLLPFCKIEKGQLTVNHEAVERYVYIQKGIQYPDGETDENWIISYQNIIKDTVSQEEINRTKREIAGLESPRSYEIKKITWWEKFKGKKPPLFERDEWKNRLQTK